MSYASKEQLKQILQKIDDNFARKDGYYTNMAVGNAENLISPDGVLDTPENDTEYNPFLFRTTAGDKSVSDGVATANKIRGRSYKWNQLVQNLAASGTVQGVTYTNNGDGSATLNGTASGDINSFYLSRNTHSPDFNNVKGHKVLLKACPAGGSLASFYAHILVGSGADWSVDPSKNDYGDGAIFTCKKAGNIDDYIYGIRFCIKDGTTLNNVVVKPMLIDLTAIYGSGNEPTTVEDFLADYPMFNSYVPYTDGSIAGVKATNIQTVGFNQWDEEWEVRGLYMYSKNYISVIPNSTYHFAYKGNVKQYPTFTLYYYDVNKNLISSELMSVNYGNSNRTTPDGCRFIKFRSATADIGTTYNHDICINLSWSGYRNGEYEAYWKQSIATRIGDYFTDGMHGVGSAYDELTSTRAIKRFGIVNLGTLNWTYASSAKCFYSSTANNIKPAPSDSSIVNYIKCSIYDETESANHLYSNNDDYNKKIGINNSGWIFIKDLSYNNSTAFRDAMAGVYLIYELATPVETPIDPPINFNYRVSDFGTEEFTYEDGDVQVPVPCELLYQNNLVGKLRNINDLTASELEEVINGLG